MLIGVLSITMIRLDYIFLAGLREMMEMVDMKFVIWQRALSVLYTPRS